MSPRSVVVLAVLLRVGWVLAVPTRPVGDFAMYLESASHLLEMGALDPEFVFMPGYVGFAAMIMAVGGGVLAIKLCVAVAAGLLAGAICGITAALWDRRAGVVAGLAYAVWPAGIAVTSVTGTDLPAAILVVTAVFCLVRWGGARPTLAAVIFGFVMGIAATVRAVAVPLAGFSFCYFLATGRGYGWRAKLGASLGRAALATAVALLVLSPWVFRNHHRYGEWFITDSHGGLTALVGANPNTDGRYSRSLNRMFKELTGYTLLAEPHRAADRASYALARDWTRFSPAYAAGLVVQKAERLLRSQAPLLYWPVYRVGVLPSGAVKSWFDRHRGWAEGMVDAYWAGLVGLFFVGVGIAIVRRRWDALWFVPLGLALVGIYALFFAEARYQLPIVGLMFPMVGGAVIFLRDALTHVRRSRGLARGLRRELAHVLATLVVAAVVLGGTSFAGAQLREHNRFAVQVCEVGGQPVVCAWRHHGQGRSPLRGIWNGVGVRLAGRGPGDTLAARAEVTLPAGAYRLRAEWDVMPVGAGDRGGGAEAEAPESISVTLRANDTAIGATDLAALLSASHQGVALPVAGSFVHGGGPLLISLEVRGRPALVAADGGDAGPVGADASVGGAREENTGTRGDRIGGQDAFLWLSKVSISAQDSFAP